jgi:hypothetical protein
MALAGRRFGAGDCLFLSWHHTRSFCQEVEQRVQSNGSFARRTIIFVFAGKARLGAPDTP